MNKIETQIFKSTFLKYFMDKYPEYAHRMRSTLHSYSGDDQCPFHIEDDCWAHTMLVLNQLELFDGDSEHTKNLNYGMMLAAILHDAGKMTSRASHKAGKINFWGHPAASVQYVIDYGYELGIPEKIIAKVAYVVSMHNSVYDILEDDSADAFRFANKDPEIANMFSKLLYADCFGQLTTSDVNLTKDIAIIDKFKKCISRTDIDMEEPEIVLICGLPGTGKTTLSKSINAFELSLDNCRLEIYKEINPNTTCSSNELYRLAFQYCAKNQTKLESKMIEHLTKCRDEKKFGAMCNVHNTISSRERSISSIKKIFGKDIKIGCIYILNTTDKIIMQDIGRIETDKSVGKEVISKFSSAQELPNLTEGFCSVSILL